MTRSEALIHLAAGILAGPHIQVSDHMGDVSEESAILAWQALAALERRHGAAFEPEPPAPIERSAPWRLVLKHNGRRVEDAPLNLELPDAAGRCVVDLGMDGGIWSAEVVRR